MRKTTNRKLLTLSRQTVRALAVTVLPGAVGAGREYTVGDTCKCPPFQTHKCPE